MTWIPAYTWLQDEVQQYWVFSKEPALWSRQYILSRLKNMDFEVNPDVRNKAISPLPQQYCLIPFYWARFLSEKIISRSDIFFLERVVVFFLQKLLIQYFCLIFLFSMLFSRRFATTVTILQSRLSKSFQERYILSVLCLLFCHEPNSKFKIDRPIFARGFQLLKFSFYVKKFHIGCK